MQNDDGTGVQEPRILVNFLVAGLLISVNTVGTHSNVGYGAHDSYKVKFRYKTYVKDTLFTAHLV